MRKTFALMILLFFTSSVVLTGCRINMPINNGNKARDTLKQQITVNLFQEVNTLDWQKASSSGENQIFSWIMEGLTRAHNGDIIPGIAEQWDISEDGKVYTFHLRDAKWSDGEFVSAEDFKYGWLRAIDPQEPKYYTYLLYDIVGAEDYSKGKGSLDMVGIKVIDSKTLEVRLNTPVTYFDYLVSFSTFSPVRQDVYEKYGMKYNTEAEIFVTNGPFKIETWKHDSEMIFVKNPEYWNTSKVKLEKVTGLMITEDSTEFNMYEAGELDHTIALDTDQKSTLTKGKVKSYSDGSVWFFDFNCEDPIMKNKNIRKALTFAIDRKLFIQKVAKAPWKPAQAYVQSEIIAGIDNTPFRAKKPEYFEDNDIEKAQELLAKGMKELEITTMPTIRLMTNDTAKAQTYAQAFQEMWSKNLGVTAQIEPVTSSVRIDRQHKHDYQVSIAGWRPDYPEPMTYLDVYVTDSGNNDVAYSNLQYDALIEAAKAQSDMVRKFELMHQAEEILMDDMPIGPLYFIFRDYAVREYVKDFYRNAFGADIDLIYSYIE